ncbi:MAG: helix-turn-helix domain-containing protein, partial [Treponema sp.]|nr:helix-turn-helix domain-containing protein [Treponema sp.]
LTLGIIIDGLADYNPVVHKMSSAETEFRQFHYRDTELVKTDPECLYVLDSAVSEKNYPRHIIIAADTLPGALTKRMDAVETLIQISGSMSAAALVQEGHTLFESHETWHKALLLAIIQHKPIHEFLELAAEKLTNPLILFDNNQAVISTAGKFPRSPQGTIWEKISDPAFVAADFCSPQELRESSIKNSEKNGSPYVFHLSADPDHTYVSLSIWINEKNYGAICMVDVNASFTDGQLSVFSQITQALKWYFSNHSIYMRIAENKVNYLDSLLEGVDISAEIVSRYLERMKWNLDGDFCFLTLTCPVDLTMPFESVSYIKQISAIFPLALVSVYQNSIIMIVRCTDYNIRRDKERQQLEKLLAKNEMRCGVSMVFHNFMRLRYYYVQSSFAAAQCESYPGSLLCYYENCQRTHILKSLRTSADPQSFCHPEILALWESGSEEQRELVHCLYHYLLNGRNLAATAKALFLHRNTLTYRLEKLSNILDNDLKTLASEQIFFYLFSCFIVIYGLS